MEDEEAKRKKNEDEGRAGRKGENLDSENETPEKTKTPEEDAEEEVAARGQVGGEDDLVPPEAGSNFEVRKHRVGRQLVLPTKAEIDNHYPLHLQYRSWCKHCVAGKARSSQHVMKDQDEER